MSEVEFVKIMAYLSAAVGKPLAPDAHEVYFDLLGDLPLEVLQLAAKRVVLAHRWATFPSVAELREAAAETQRGEVVDLSPAEAWALAWKAAGRIDLDIDGSLDRACDGLPPRVVQAMKAFSLPDLCYGKEPVSVIRAQFLRIYEQLQARDKRLALLPESLKEAVAEIGRPPAGLLGERDTRNGRQILKMAGRIGNVPE